MSPSWSDRVGRTSIFLWLAVGAAAARGATVVIPAAAAPEEIKAAEELRHVWLIGTGSGAQLRREDAHAEKGDSSPIFYLGETRLAQAQAPLPPGIGEDGFRVRTLPGSRVVLRGASGTATVLAADWYAQHGMGARWFMPGPTGEVVPSLTAWSPAALDRVVEPAFVSREFSGLDEAGKEWARRNGLHGTLPHAHAMRELFPAALFAAHPDWFPLLEGRRYRPVSPKDYDWQPNLALPEVAAHAAGEADAYFAAHPGAGAMSLSINDSIRFDQSAATLRARGPLRWFRGRPDYSDLVFGFMNRVADDLRQSSRGKLLNAYAYYWCENAPSFPVRENIVPWLTADRSQWYDRAFRREDRALMVRWCRSGARIVGIYDYLYGAPFLVPRETTRLTAESIAFAHKAGVRAYAAEAYPSWGLDGPKLWVAAQLLWNPGQSVDALLDDYYSHFWGESGPSMRRFYEGCAKAWSRQPGPASWLKYYRDEDQAGLFPPSLCARLRSCIEDARAMAKSPELAARVDLVSRAFAVTERFSAFCALRTALSLAASAPAVDRAKAQELIQDNRRARTDFEAAYTGAAKAGAMAPIDIGPYLLDDPAPEMEARLRQQPPGFLAVAGPSDQGWRTLKTPPRLDDLTFTWSTSPWFGRGEPVKGRAIEVATDSAGRGVVTYRNCKLEHLQQWSGAIPGLRYEVSVGVHGRVSPGNQTYLMINWMDAKYRYIGRPSADRLPGGDWSKGKVLIAAGTAPPGAAFIGVAIYACNQAGGDYASFSDLSFRAWGLPIGRPGSGN
jgi:hypothetical protein